MSAAAGSTNASSSVAPSDGRLRGQDFVAAVTSVAWPNQTSVAGRSVEAPPAHRFVVFALSLSENPASVTTAGTPPVSARVVWDNSSAPLSLTTIDNQILAAGAAIGWPTGTDQFTVAVPNTTHAVDLVVSEGSFSQSFDLWTLRRTPPTPAVLYRDPSTPTLSGTGAAPGALALSNPSDGFSSSASVTLQSAALGYFPPSGAGSAPLSPNQAVLSVVLDGEFPNDPNDPTGSGHYLGSKTPLPTSLVTFTPSGGSAVSATESGAGVNTGKGSNDNGLFDATYSFVVPANLTTGTISVGAGSFSGAEFTLYTAEEGNTTLDITSPMTLAISFPVVQAEAAQKTPPWVGQPLPPTADPSLGSSGSSGSSGGFPIWLAVLALAVLAGGVVIVQRRRQRTPASATSVSAPPPATSPADGSLVDAVDRQTPPDQQSALPAAVATETPRETPRPAVNVLGPLEVLGLAQRCEPKFVEELLVYLVLHDHRHLRAGQIQLGMWPVGSSRPEIAEKTMRNYLSKLRTCVGPQHLPETSGTDGYLIRDVGSDWATFQRLVREADAIGGERAIELRTEALALVRGQPFDKVTDGYEWVDEEHLRTDMTIAIAKCALALAADHYEAGRHDAAVGAARSGLKGAVDDFELWQIGARAIHAKGDNTALRRWVADASAHLDAADMARMSGSLGADHDADQS